MTELPPTAGLPLRAGDLLPWGDADLEGHLARWLGVPAVQLTCSGTAALLLALQVLRAQTPSRDEVVVPAYTCRLVALAVARAGLRLRLCDLAPGTLDLHLPALQALCGPRTLAVLPTHLCGLVTDVAGPAAVARAAGAWVIEDAAQALGARVAGQPLGLQGDIGLYSLAAGKGLTLYEGGLLVSARPALRAALREAGPRLLPPRPAWELRRSLELLGYAACYRPRGLRWVYGQPLRRALAHDDRVAAAGDDIGADIPLHAVGRWRRRVGVRALARLPAHWQAAEQRWQQRRNRLMQAGLPVLGDSPAVPAAQGVRPLLLLAFPDAGLRDALLQRLWGAGLGVSLPFAATLADYPPDAAGLAVTAEGPLVHARVLAGRLLAITNSGWLDEPGFEALLAQLLEGLGRVRAG
ncbi:DegT/DnrJ/EryC1/StrS family aminotransferase [Aquincola tertiaricarbonis]|uniref:DegT/DnrJ/EryC1/StrS family aminotransferase n=1 Tax=Aquincola tertiaricarbonis TaxID=391953 RepID=A0ABY4S938_AQUTE|nr:DegT/DnrJ/EryC1/StrS family aminotransferase [Aquincola tertiaricarbonis]URI08531.1 DegT/DnrJ/EryC1/StrS family aminotransferase [Aquincola tertiaricarbonis]